MSPQQKRVAEQQDGEHANDGAKKSRALAIPVGVVKQEPREQGGEEAGHGAEGEGALVPAMEEPQINNIRMAVSCLHCHACGHPLKPPTYKCQAGHVVCGACRDSHFLACAAAGAGTYVHCAELDRMVRKAEVPCAYEKYGCTSWVVYFEELDHRCSCRFAPCLCPEPGCGLSTSPARLAEHFSSHHAWPVTEVDYKKPFKLAVPGSQDKQVLLQVLVGKADGCVFLMSSCALGAAMAVSLVCVRACGDAAAGSSQYCCKLWAQVAGNKDSTTATFMVASSDLAGGIPAADQGMFLAVPSPLLQDESGEPAILMVRIDEGGVPAASARSRSPSTTQPSSLPRRRN